MNDQEIRVYQMFTRVRDFGTGNAGAFPVGSMGAGKFTALDGVINELDRHGMEESSGRDAAKVSTGSKKSARESLRAQMEAISQTAKRMAASTPGMENSFRMPRANGDQALLNAARAFVADAGPLKERFIEWEMPGAFLENLGGAIESFEHSVNTKNLSQSKSVAATAAIDEANKRGKQIVSDLDAIVRNKFRDNPATLAAWESASHVERAPRKKKEAAENAQPVPS
jgi:hypothetical protein